MTVHVPDHKPIDADALAQIFTEARTHNGFFDKPVPDELLRKAVDLAKMGPTSVNQSPLRIVFLTLQGGQGSGSRRRFRPATSIRRSPRRSSRSSAMT